MLRRTRGELALVGKGEGDGTKKLIKETLLETVFENVKRAQPNCARKNLNCTVRVERVN